MHRVKVRVVEDALDANNTIARANRDDFDRDGRDGRQPDERPGRGQDDAARAGTARGLGGLRVGVLEGDVQGSLDADRLAAPAHPGDAAQHRQRLRRRVPPRREHGALGAARAPARRRSTC